MWNTNSGLCFVTFTEHSSSVTNVAFTSSGFVVVSASLDGTVRAFDLHRYQLLSIFNYVFTFAQYFMPWFPLWRLLLQPWSNQLKILSLITRPHVIPNPVELCSCLEHKLRCFLLNLRAFWSCIDRNGTTTFKTQKDIVKIAHVTSVVQP